MINFITDNNDDSSNSSDSNSCEIYPTEADNGRADDSVNISFYNVKTEIKIEADECDDDYDDIMQNSGNEHTFSDDEMLGGVKESFEGNANRSFDGGACKAFDVKGGKKSFGGNKLFDGSAKRSFDESAKGGLEKGNELYGEHEEPSSSGKNIENFSVVKRFKSEQKSDSENEQTNYDKPIKIRWVGHDRLSFIDARKKKRYATIKLSPKDGNYKCTDCDFVTVDAVTFKNHRRVHVPKTECKVCGQHIRTDNFAKHQVTHQNAMVQCKICGKTYKNEESMRSHLLMHVPGESFCEICGKKFMFKGEYKRHVKNHKGELFFCFFFYLLFFVYFLTLHNAYNTWCSKMIEM